MLFGLMIVHSLFPLGERMEIKFELDDDDECDELIVPRFSIKREAANKKKQEEIRRRQQRLERSRQKTDFCRLSSDAV